MRSRRKDTGSWGDLRLPREALLLSSAELDREHRELLVGRLRMLFTVGMLASLVLIAGARVLAPYRRTPFETAIDVVLIASFLAGRLWIARPDASSRELQTVALVVLSFVALVLPMQASEYPIALGAALILFVPAAVIPWRPRHQTALASIIVAAYLFVHLVVSIDHAPPVFGMEEWTTLVGLMVLGVTSVLVTHALYSLRRTARRARRLGAYEVERELARGGMGRVFVARHARMGRLAAVKVLVPQAGERTDTALARFEREVRLASTLSHPNTITIFDYGRGESGALYYAMEYLEGWDLQTLVERYGCPAIARSVHILIQVCASLGEAHERGIVHRDLKPSNIFVTRIGGTHDFVKVLDFGVAKAFRVSGVADEGGLPEGVTTAGTVVGTPTYMPPEAAMATGHPTPESDIYSLGGVAYFLLCGRPPFVHDSPLQVLASHIGEEPSPPSALSELEVPPALDAIVLRCLSKRPEDRFADAGELWLALAALEVEPRWTASEAAAWWADHPPPT